MGDPIKYAFPFGPTFLLGNGSIPITNNWDVDGTGLLFIDYINKRIGINNSLPAYNFDVNGSASISGNLAVNTNNLYVDSATGNVGIGTTNPLQKLEVDGGVRLNTATVKPTADATSVGTMWITQGGAGIADILEVCLKSATDTYSWINIATG